ncbi:MAG: DUF4349 domain-containing protein [Myxococcota bacterium]
MRVVPCLWAIGMGVVLLACTSTPDAEFARAGREASTAGAMAASDTAAPPPSAAAVQRLLIRNADLALDVEDLDAATAAVEARVVAIGGLVRHSGGDDDRRSLQVGVPNDRLEAFLDHVAELGEVTRRSLRSEDVTEQHADLVAEIENTRSFRDRLRQLLERAKSVEEVLQVERELTRVQTQLDRLEARKRRLDSDVALATVYVHLERAERAVPGPLAIAGYGVYWLVEKLWKIPLPR